MGHLTLSEKVSTKVKRTCDMQSIKYKQMEKKKKKSSIILLHIKTMLLFLRVQAEDDQRLPQPHPISKISASLH